MPGKHAQGAAPRKRKKKGRRAVAIVLVCLILAGAAGAGGYYYLQKRSNSTEVNVYPVSQLGYVNDWAERVQTGGTVRADKMQAVRLSTTQTVTEVFVQEGQQVKVGDPLLAFDTTLSEVELERARIEIEKKKLDIKNTQDELAKIDTYKIGTPGGGGYYQPPVTSEPLILEPTAVPYFQGGSGTMMDPYVFLWEEGRLISDSVIRNLLTMALPTPSPEPSFAPETGADGQYPGFPLISSEPMEPVSLPGAPDEALEALPTPVGSGQLWSVRALLAPARGGLTLRAEGEGGDVPSDPGVGEPEATEPPATEAPTAPLPPTDPPFIPLETPVAPVEDEPWAQDTEPPAETDWPEEEIPTASPEPSATPEPSESPEPSGSPEPSQDPNATASPEPTRGPTGAEYYMVFEIRESNSMQGDVTRAFEIRFVLVNGAWTFEVVQPAYVPYVPETDLPEDDFGFSFGGGYSGEYYTAEEIARMRDEAKQKLLDLNLSLRVAEQELKEKEFELSNGEVLCTTDGVVKSVLTPEEALASDQPVVMISGGGGYFVTCYMSEFDLEYMGVGDTVTVEDYRSGSTLEGTITEVSEYPAGENDYANYYYDSGNSNVSTYPFTIEIGEDADLREGYGVSVYYSPAEKLKADGGDGSYFELTNMFIRRENGRSYVYAMDENGRLEQRWLTTEGGDGYSTRVVSGLDMDTDYVAFPYGRAVKEGAKAVKQEDISTLYNGY